MEKGPHLRLSDENENENANMIALPPPRRSRLFYLSFEDKAALVAAVGGTTFGYDIGVISGALVSLKRDFGLDAHAEGTVVAMIAIGQIPGALIGGFIADRFGRKPAIFIQNGCFVLGTVITASATEIGHLFLGQFVLGVGVAFSVASNISYVTEMVPRERSGAMVACYELAVTFGVR